MILLVHEQSSTAMELHIKSYMAVCKSQQTEAEFCVFIRLWYLDKFRTPKSCRWGPQPWKSMTNLDSRWKTRAITQPSKVRLIKATVIPVVMYGCESWTITKVPKNWRSQIVVLEKTLESLRVLWTARRSNQSILKGISPEYSLEGLMLMVKLQYFGHLIWRTNSLEKTLMLGEIEGNKRRGRQRMRCLDCITNSKHMSSSKLWEIVKDREAWCAAVHGVTELDMTKQLKNKKIRCNSILNEIKESILYYPSLFFYNIYPPIY